MSFFKASKKEADVKQGGSGGKYIGRSGIFPVTILAPFVSVSGGGSTSVDFFLDHAEQEQTIYGNLRITNNDGSTNEIGAKVFNQLTIIAEVDEVSEPIDGELPIGKAGAMKDAAILEDLSDVDVLMRVQMEYQKYAGSFQEKKVIKGFYRASDNATAEEIVNDKDFGKGFEGDQEYVNNITYRESKKGANDAPTPEEIKQWIKDKRPKNTANGASGASASGKTPGFAKKKSGFRKKS